jgi:hypothetical protein
VGAELESAEVADAEAAAGPDPADEPETEPAKDGAMESEPASESESPASEARPES